MLDLVFAEFVTVFMHAHYKYYNNSWHLTFTRKINSLVHLLSHLSGFVVTQCDKISLISIVVVCT